MINLNHNSGNNILTITLVGFIFGMIHFFGKEEEKRYEEMLELQKKITNLTALCKEMKEEIKKIQEQEKTIKNFISLSDLAHKNVIETNTGIDYEDCIEQYIERYSEQCVEQFIHLEDSKDNNIEREVDEIYVSGRNRSNSLSSILGTTKKMVFG